jgi:amino acid transporter
MFVGGVLLGAIFSVLSYFGIKKLLKKEVNTIKNYVKKVAK